MGTTRYELRVQGRLAPATVTSLGELHVTVEPAATLLRGDFDDAGLRGCLSGLQDLGLELLALRQVSGTAEPADDRTDLYDLRVRGDLDALARTLLDPVQVRAQEDLLVLVCRADDHAHMQGLIDMVRACHLELVEIRPSARSA